MSRVNHLISVVIPTFNCANDLEQCLQSVKWANEIIVVDMGSIDNTVKIAKKFGAKIYLRVPSNGNFDTNRKFGLEKANSEWILKLDSDEKLSPELEIEIQNFLQTDDGKFDGFNLYNHIFVLGHQIKHGFIKPNSHELRLVRNGKWHYDPYRFHQLITVDGKVGFLKGYYEHYNIRSVSKFIEKMNRYTDLDSEYYSNNVSLIMIFLAPIKTFFKLSVLQLGFLDGYIGIVVCGLYSLYNFVEKIKVWERQNI